MLKLRMSDIADESWQLKALIVVKEQKTGKTNRTEPTKNLKAVREEYKLSFPHIISEGDNFVFFRSKSKTGAMRWTEWITVKQWGRIITSACKSVGLVGSYSSHSLRKSFGYQARVSWVPIEKIQQKLNHSTDS